MGSSYEVKQLTRDVERLHEELRSVRSDLIKLALTIGEVRGEVLDLAERTTDGPR